MNKSLNVFLSVLLCAVLCVGVLTSLSTTDESASQYSQKEYTSSIPTGTGAPSVSFGVGARGNDLAVPMSSRRSSREQYLQPSRRFTGVADLQGFARSANSKAMLSLPSLQGGDGGRLFTHMSSSQTMKSFGGGSNATGVSMSGGVVSTNSQSPIANNQLSVLSLPSPMFASQQMLADDVLAMNMLYGGMSEGQGPRGIRKAPPGINQDNIFSEWFNDWSESEPDWNMTYEELYAFFMANIYNSGYDQSQWNDFWAWYQREKNNHLVPVGDAVPVLLLFVFIFGIYTCINLKNKNYRYENNL